MCCNKINNHCKSFIHYSSEMKKTLKIYTIIEHFLSLISD